MSKIQTIQKTLRVFRIITIIASIVCVIAAAVSGTGALCAITQYNGGQVLHLFGEPLDLFADWTDLLQKSVYLLSVTLMLIAQAILLGATHSYLKAELADGTPFTEGGAERLKKLGIRFIWIPVVVVAISEAVAIWQGVKRILIIGNVGCVMTGIVLILAAMISRYGAELEQKALVRHENTDAADRSRQ